MNTNSSRVAGNGVWDASPSFGLTHARLEIRHPAHYHLVRPLSLPSSSHPGLTAAAPGSLPQPHFLVKSLDVWCGSPFFTLAMPCQRRGDAEALCLHASMFSSVLAVALPRPRCQPVSHLRRTRSIPITMWSMLLASPMALHSLVSHAASNW
jgi:hypothetical protein